MRCAPEHPKQKRSTPRRASFFVCLSQRQNVLVLVDLLQGAVRKVPGFAVQRFVPVGAHQVGAVRQGEEMPFSAVGQGNVLHPLSVQDVLPDELVVGQDARFGQAEAVQPAAVAGVGGFARLLRGGIHQPGGVHAAGAHAQHDAVVIVEQPRQAQLGKKVVLGGHMAAAQHHKAAAGQQGADLFLIAGIAGHKFGQGQVGVRKALQEYPAHLVVLGVNGAGKSTLVKGICGELPLMSGTLRRGQGLTIGYFAQHQLDSLRLDETPLQHLRRMAPDTREQELRDFLGKFRFSGDQVNELVAPMSGGEKARLALALIAWEKPNLLVLDEPTNHLDMETREALTIALSTFGGSVLIVSHDRHLLRAATETLWLVRGGHVSAYDGDLDDYAELVLSDRRDRAAAQKEENRSAAAPVVTQKEARREAAKERARIASLRKPVQKKIDAAEKRMAEIDARAAELDAQIADPAFYSGEKAQVEETLKERSALTEEKETLEAEWLELSEELESIK